MEGKVGIHIENDDASPFHYDLSFRTWSRSNAFSDTLTLDQLDMIWPSLSQALYLHLRDRITNPQPAAVEPTPRPVDYDSKLDDEISF